MTLISEYDNKNQGDWSGIYLFPSVYEEINIEYIKFLQGILKFIQKQPFYI